MVLCQQAYWASLLLSKNEKEGLDLWVLSLLDINTTDIFSYHNTKNNHTGTGGGAFGLMELKRSSSISSANRLCAAGFTELGLEL